MVGGGGGGGVQISGSSDEIHRRVCRRSCYAIQKSFER